MQAMILAAGMGSRLLPLTETLPKPLFPILNIPNLERIVSSLVKCNFSRIIINTFHHARLIEEWCLASPFREVVNVVRERELLGTGGGVKNAVDLFRINTPLLVVNSDIVTDLDFAKAVSEHKYSGMPASLVVHSRDPFNNVRVKGGMVTGFNYFKDDAVAFTGISVIEPGEIVSFTGPVGSLLEIFMQVIVQYGGCNAIDASSLSSSGIYLWEDMGTPAGYLHSHELLMEREKRSVLKGIGTILPPDLSIRGWASIGSEVSFGRNVDISRVVIWDGVRVDDDASFQDVILTPGMIIKVKNPVFKGE